MPREEEELLGVDGEGPKMSGISDPAKRVKTCLGFAGVHPESGGGITREQEKLLGVDSEVAKVPGPTFLHAGVPRMSGTPLYARACAPPPKKSKFDWL